ncbi:hypothetical protein FRB96_009191 [Tulasnella sp. 330]|nr:hypothetical protein FRB96_009191 [Tulasnella sp. 330]KAG8880303.1 hypothetical protein FRB98_005194 [Tulasnella sp. 332]KAG8880896.1 hypothetical protein FRB97_000340 [Tulasnella sp. 331]
MPASSKASNRSPAKSSKVDRDDSESIRGEEDVASQQGSGDDDEVEEDEYEIEHIIEAKRNKVTLGNWAFLVKWKNYPDSENSWVDEPDFFSKDMIDKYWDTHPEIKGNPKTRRVSSAAKPRKSDTGSRSQLPKSASARSLAKSGGQKSTDVSSDEEAAPAKKSSKRKATAKVESDEDGDAVMEDIEPATKKAKKAGPATNKTTYKRKIEPSPSSAENGFFSPHGDSDDGHPSGHVPDVAEKYKNKRSWEDLVEHIDTVEHGSEDDLVIYFTTAQDEKGMAPSTVFNHKAPQKMIQFYESHLRWRKTQAEDAEAERLGTRKSKR